MANPEKSRGELATAPEQCPAATLNHPRQCAPGALHVGAGSEGNVPVTAYAGLDVDVVTHYVGGLQISLP